MCLECNNEYYLNSNICSPGLIPNCIKYLDSNKGCIKCKKGFMLIKNAIPESYCFPLPTSFNCEEFHTEDFQRGILNCIKCSDPSQFYISSKIPISEPSTDCINFALIDKCSVYDVQSLPSYSTFECLDCSSGFVLDNKKCIPKTINVANCKTASTKVVGACSECNDKFFLSSDGKTCSPFPVGISFCKTYRDRNNCQVCEKSFYLNLTVSSCLRVSDNQAVSNCLYYNSFQTCIVCQDNFVLTPSKRCEQVLARNCLTALNTTACATCPPLMKLETTDTITNCQQIPDTKCIEFNLSGKFMCTKCSPEFYADNFGKCKPVSKTITNCKVYSSATTCSQCQPGYLNNNFISCTLGSIFSPNFDANCADSVNDNSLICLSCQGGKYFDSNGRCVDCNIKGCFYCDPGANPPVCLMCQSGFYMNEQQNCTQWDLSIDGGKKSAGRVVVGVVLVMMLLFNS